MSTNRSRRTKRPSVLTDRAGPRWIVGALAAAVLVILPIVGSYKWSGTYYRAVAQEVDQIAVMTYDSMAPHPALYRLWLREQVRGIWGSLAGSDVQLLAGLSVSRENTFTHRPNAENMNSRLAGICAGLSAAAHTNHAIDGVALYASWEAEANDWAAWEAWLSAVPVSQ
jgi:hypothetical protein